MRFLAVLMRLKLKRLSIIIIREESLVQRLASNEEIPGSNPGADP